MEGEISKSQKWACSVIATFTATTCVHPFDVLRISQQGDFASKYTLSSLYRGYSVGLLRQCTYSVPNVMIYSELQNAYASKHKQNPSFWTKFGMGVISGTIGGFTGTPSELMMVRSIHPNTPNPGIVPSITTIWANYGLRGFFRGYHSTIARSAVFNGTRLSVYSETKSTVLRKYPDLDGTTISHILSAICGTTAGIIASNPLDVIKTRVQLNQDLPLQNVVRNVVGGGVRTLYKGFAPSLSKSIPHSVISFVILERLTRMISGKDAF